MLRLVIVPLATLCVALAPAPVSHGAPTNVREFFPYFAYTAAADWSDIRFQARRRGVSPRRFMDVVCADLRRHGFNTVWLNNLDYALLPRWLRAARRHGLKVIAQGANFYPGPGQTWRDVRPGPAGRRIAREARRYRGDPTLLMYVVSEEPDPDPLVIRRISKVIAAVRRADPTHPAVAEYHWVDALRLAARLTRPPVIVFGQPTTPTPPSEEDRIVTFPQWHEEAFQAAQGARAPLWSLASVSHVHPYQDGVPVPDLPRPRRPTLAEMRWRIWYGLLHGAKGIGWFIYSWPYPLQGRGYEEDLSGLVGPDGSSTPEYEEAARVARRLRPLESILRRLEPERWTSDSSVRSRFFRDRKTGARYVMVVNEDLEAAHSISPSLGGGQLAPGDGVLRRLGP